MGGILHKSITLTLITSRSIVTMKQKRNSSWTSVMISLIWTLKDGLLLMTRHGKQWTLFSRKRTHLSRVAASALSWIIMLITIPMVVTAVIMAMAATAMTVVTATTLVMILKMIRPSMLSHLPRMALSKQLLRKLPESVS